MARTEIRYFSGYRDEGYSLVQGEQILDPEVIVGPDAIHEGYQRFKALMGMDGLLQASVQRDFSDNMTVDITLGESVQSD